MKNSLFINKTSNESMNLIIPKNMYILESLSSFSPNNKQINNGFISFKKGELYYLMGYNYKYYFISSSNTTPFSCRSNVSTGYVYSIFFKRYN